MLNLSQHELQFVTSIGQLSAPHYHRQQQQQRFNDAGDSGPISDVLPCQASTNRVPAMRLTSAGASWMPPLLLIMMRRV